MGRKKTAISGLGRGPAMRSVAWGFEVVWEMFFQKLARGWRHQCFAALCLSAHVISDTFLPGCELELTKPAPSPATFINEYLKRKEYWQPDL